VLDPSWADHIQVRGKMLFVIEGLSMYLTAEENAKMLGIIRSQFDNAYVILECLAKR
jgi:O-methyltransferase involved in polyketide biosynthesis